MCDNMNVPYLGSIPLDPRIGGACDRGVSFLHEFGESPASKAYLRIVEEIKVVCGDAVSVAAVVDGQ